MKRAVHKDKKTEESYIESNHPLSDETKIFLYISENISVKKYERKGKNGTKSSHIGDRQYSNEPKKHRIVKCPSEIINLSE